MFRKTTLGIKRQLILYSLLIFTGIVLAYIWSASNIFAILDNSRFNNDPNQQLGTPIFLPFNKFLAIQNNEGMQVASTHIIRNHGGIQSPSTQMDIPSKATKTTPNSISCNNGNLDDNFDSTYNLKAGQVSPNGKWQNVYNGFGSSGVEKVSGSKVFFLKPKTTTSPTDTQAALVKSTGAFCNFVLNFDIKTVKQLRQNSAPNPWEVGWIIFRYTDTFHYYWFRIATDGIELGKKDCDTCSNSVDGQEFLVTKDSPTVQLNKWSHWIINIVGNHIQITVDGKLLTDFIDQKMSPKLSSGTVAMYSEDAYVRYDNMHLISK